MPARAGARRLREGRDRAGRRRRSSPTAPAAATGRCASGSRERHGVEPGRVLLTSGSLQGFVFLAQHLVGVGRRVLVEGPTYDRPLLILARLGAEIVPLPMDDEGLDPDALERALADGEKPALLYTIPTFQNPSGRTLSTERRHRIAELAARARAARARGRPVRARPLRGRGAADAVRARGRRERRLLVVVLEDGRAGRPRRLLRAAGRPGGGARGRRGLDVHLAALPERGDGARVHPARQLRAEPRARPRPARRAARRDARGARARVPRRARAGAAPRAATSSGSTCRAASTPASCSCARPPPASRSSRAPTSSPGRAARAPSVSRTASRRSRRSARGSRRSPSYLPPRRRRRARSGAASRPATRPSIRLRKITQVSAMLRGPEDEVHLHPARVQQQEHDGVDDDDREGDLRGTARARRRARRVPPRSPSRLPRARAAEPRACRAAAGTSRGCRGGTSEPMLFARNVGQGVSPGSAQSPAQRK